PGFPSWDPDRERSSGRTVRSRCSGAQGLLLLVVRRRLVPLGRDGLLPLGVTGHGTDPVGGGGLVPPAQHRADPLGKIVLILLLAEREDPRIGGQRLVEELLDRRRLTAGDEDQLLDLASFKSLGDFGCSAHGGAVTAL